MSYRTYVPRMRSRPQIRYVEILDTMVSKMQGWGLACVPNHYLPLRIGWSGKQARMDLIKVLVVLTGVITNTTKSIGG